MKKTLSILAVAVMTLGLFSCEAETDVAETENLFESIGDQDSTTGNNSGQDDGRN
ncbi:hypothetical protein [Flagellimonas sp. S3867]|uniref:hypothetical protein n=1 Tax=Flagellimonas sp. S3867 TaxID=2768063 RepID=UPI0016865AA9|nr:hypothetical protein [Flagellimonas sp. S3867]